MKAFVHLIGISVLMLLGCGNSPVSPGSVSSGDPGVIVSGRVLSAYRQPVEGATIIIPGKPAVISDRQGNFRVPGVHPPYNAVVKMTDPLLGEAHPTLYVYTGLNRLDPVLFADQWPAMGLARIIGSLSGQHIPQPPGYASLVSYSSRDVESGTMAMVDTSGSFLVDGVTWLGSGSSQGTIHALQWRADSDGQLVDYSYGRQTGVTLTPPIFDGQTMQWDGSETAVPPVALAAIPANRISGSFDACSACVLQSATWFIQFERDSLAERFLSSRSPSPTFEHQVPDVESARFAADVTASDSVHGGEIRVYKGGLVPGQTGVSISIPSISPEPVSSPDDGFAQVEFGTAFHWSAVSGSTSIIHAWPNGAGPSYHIFTNDNSAQIPNLSDYGIALPRAARYSWQVQVDPSSADMDHAMSNQGLFETNPSFSRPWKYSRDAAQGLSRVRSFTTAP